MHKTNDMLLRRHDRQAKKLSQSIAMKGYREYRQQRMSRLTVQALCERASCRTALHKMGHGATSHAISRIGGSMPTTHGF